MSLFGWIKQLDPTSSDSIVGKVLVEIDPTNPNSTVGEILPELDPTSPHAALGTVTRTAGDTALSMFGAPPGTFTAASQGIQELNSHTGNAFTLNNIRAELSGSQPDNATPDHPAVDPVNTGLHSNSSGVHQSYPMESSTHQSDTASFSHQSHHATSVNYDTQSGNIVTHYNDGDVSTYNTSGGTLTQFDAQTGNLVTHHSDGDVTTYNANSGEMSQYDYNAQSDSFVEHHAHTAFPDVHDA
jgi:YD repeat-containing protein